MFKLETDTMYIASTTIQGYDSSTGMPMPTVRLAPGTNLLNLESAVTELQAWRDSFEANRFIEEELRAANPALQDAYEKYQLVLGLIKEESDGSSIS